MQVTVKLDSDQCICFTNGGVTYDAEMIATIPSGDPVVP